MDDAGTGPQYCHHEGKYIHDIGTDVQGVSVHLFALKFQSMSKGKDLCALFACHQTQLHMHQAALINQP